MPKHVAVPDVVFCALQLICLLLPFIRISGGRRFSEFGTGEGCVGAYKHGTPIYGYEIVSLAVLSGGGGWLQNDKVRGN
jgi:hypothetical protein